MRSEAKPLSAAVKLALWLVLIGIAALAIYATRPPRALPEAAPAEQFSAARAMRHVAQIAREPHPIGTAANRRVRDYLIEQLTALGAEVELQPTLAITDGRRQIYAATAENIFATIRGTANSSTAVMLTSHYDSVPEGPGAADAASGLAAILETLRAVRASGPLKNDLLVLFSDGEEEGLIGAAGFVREHPEMVARVGVVMNLEARGTSGPALMFETSDRNGWLTREFARAAPHPFSSSLAYAVYKLLPNQTDMTVFKRAGMPGLNFAFNATLENYHTPRDTPENLDPRSLQNIGANALALTRHFGNLELRATRAPDRIYFNWFGSRLIDYPQWLAWPILAAAFVLLVALLVIARRRGEITVARTTIGFGGLVLVVVAALTGAHCVFWAVGMFTERLLVGDTISNSLLALACLAAALASVVAVQSWLASGLGACNSVAGQLLALTFATAALTYFLPAASYLLQWPLLFALAGMVAALLTESRAPSALLASVPAVLIFSPLMYLLFVALGFDIIAVSVLAVFLALLLALMSPLTAQMSRPLRISVPVLLVSAAGLAVAGVQLTRFNVEHPRRNSLFYAVDADARKAAWVSYDKATDSWTRQFLSGSPTRGKAPAFTVGSARETMSTAAELLPIEAPTATVLADSVSGDRRTLKLHLKPSANAHGLLMRFPADLNILSVAINGLFHEIRNSGEADAPWLLRYNTPPPEGTELELHLGSAARFVCWLGERTYGLPEAAANSYPTRPPETIPTYGSDVTLVTRRYQF